MSHPGGRPTKYKERYCQELVDYFTVPMPDPGNPHSMCYYPTFYGFCARINVDDEIIADWCKAHEEFHRAYKKACNLAKNQLVHGGLTNKYNSNFAKFVGANIGMVSENTKAEVNQSVSYPTGISIRFITPTQGDDHAV